MVQLDAYAANLPMEDTAAVARAAEGLGFGGLWFTETQRPPYLACAVALEATEAMTVGTAIAVAFPRSPMVTAQTAWELARAGRGRFSLGLGSQVKAHIERRFSMPFEHPAPKLRDYVLALRAIFRAFQGDEPLRYEGDFYSFSLLTDFFSPGPMAWPAVPVGVAGVNPGMARLAGEVCDTFHVHPLHSREYLADVLLPAVATGAAATGRPASAVEIICPVFVIVGDTEAERAPRRESIRRQIAFYASTRTYRPVLELHGWGDVTDELHRAMGAGDHGAMARAVTDEMVDAYSVTATWDGLAPELRARYSGLAHRVFSYEPVQEWIDSPAVAERWRLVATALRASR